MIILLGSRDDVLTREVFRRLDSAGLDPRILTEDTLFSGTPFAFEYGAASLSGFLGLDGEEIPLNRIAAVLVRVPRNWWPASDLDTQDQMFVYHENLASWIALICSLDCTVINRFAIDWWLGDATFSESLCLRLAEFVSLSVAMREPPLGIGNRLMPTPEHGAYEPSSVYVVGNTLIDRGAGAASLVHHLARHNDALAAWQEETGVQFCRIDCDTRVGIRLKYIEAFPVLDKERANLVQRLGEAVTEMLK